VVCPDTATSDQRTAFAQQRFVVSLLAIQTIFGSVIVKSAHIARLSSPLGRGLHQNKY
jgi:hypothetical protein